MIEFYTRHFDYEQYQNSNDRIVELCPKSTGVSILLHPASKGQKEGQALVKLVFDIERVEKFHADAEEKGLKFGPVHKANGYVFANAKDPSGNSISISSRAFSSQIP